MIEITDSMSEIEVCHALYKMKPEWWPHIVSWNTDAFWIGDDEWPEDNEVVAIVGWALQQWLMGDRRTNFMHPFGDAWYVSFNDEDAHFGPSLIHALTKACVAVGGE